MEWKDWKHWYDQIVVNLGLDPSKDMESAILLRSLEAHRRGDIRDLDRLIRGKEAIVLGPAPFSDTEFGGAVVISAGTTTDQLVEMDIWPDIIVTDLDGNVPAQVEANSKGALAVIHAHGDNIEAIREWVPRFSPPIIGTTQNEPIEDVYNFGGFTDGDRSVLMAAHFGASRIILRGFDFDNPTGKPIVNMELKRKKLAYAKQIIDYVARTGGTEIIQSTE
jgi:uncharacterized Rossmann fold enzyme